jgi:hypothetical protein
MFERTSCRQISDLCCFWPLERLCSCGAYLWYAVDVSSQDLLGRIYISATFEMETNKIKEIQTRSVRIKV